MVSVLLFVTLTAGGESLDFGRRGGCCGSGGLFGGGLFGGKRASGFSGRYSGGCGPVYGVPGCSGGIPPGVGRFVSDVKVGDGELVDLVSEVTVKDGKVFDVLSFKTQPVISGITPNANSCKVAIFSGHIAPPVPMELPPPTAVDATGTGAVTDPTRVWTIPANTLPVPAPTTMGSMKTLVIWAYTSQGTIVFVERFSVRIKVR